MIRNKESIRRRILSTFLLSILLFTLLSGCSKGQPESQGSTPLVKTPPATVSNMNDTTKQLNPQTDATVSDTEGIPDGVTIKKVIKDEVIKNDYRKMVELLSDGGKRITITDLNRKVIMRQLEYEGVILEVAGDEVTVQVERGGQQTLTIPSDVVIDDEDKLGLNKGVEIEWEVDTDGEIISVELDD